MGRTRYAPDGTAVRPLESIEKKGGKYRVFIRWTDPDGNVWDPCDLVRDAPMRARPSRCAASKHAAKAKKVNVNFSELSDARRTLSLKLDNMSDRDRSRIEERLNRKPKEGLGVSFRDTLDLERAADIVDRKKRLEGMVNARIESSSEIFGSVLQSARALNFRRVDGRELDPMVKRIADEALKNARR